jgi:putative secretion ATPase (PEP-CTERM system associated)
VYAQYYNYTGLPFQLTPDSRFFFGSSGHSRAISHLVYGLAQEEGFVVITGEVGAGKTTLTEQLWSQLDRKTYVVGRVVTTQVAGDDLLRLVLASFGLQTEGVDKATMLRRLEDLLRIERQHGRRCLLVVDEVQNLSFAALEELRMLSNLTVPEASGSRQVTLQTILLGQPQFRRILASPDLEQLRQRVLASYHLGPLSAPETRDYIRHRLSMVGWTGENPSWDEAAFEAVHRAAGGIPRRVNTLCGRVLLFGALGELQTIDAAAVQETSDELQRDLGAGAPVNGFPPALHDPPNGAASRVPLDRLEARIDALEATAARQDRVFRRLTDLLSGAA